MKRVKNFRNHHIPMKFKEEMFGGNKKLEWTENTIKELL